MIKDELTRFLINTKIDSIFDVGEFGKEIVIAFSTPGGNPIYFKKMYFNRLTFNYIDIKDFIITRGFTIDEKSLIYLFFNSKIEMRND